MRGLMGILSDDGEEGGKEGFRCCFLWVVCWILRVEVGRS